MQESKGPISETLGKIKELDQERKELENPHVISSKFEKLIMALLLMNIKELVDMPEKVEVKAIVGQQTVCFEVKVDKSDLGKLIGKRGNTVQALRKLLVCWASKHKKRAVLEVVE